LEKNLESGKEFSCTAINQGVFLTKTRNSGNGTVIELEDAGFFTDGYEIGEGDLIRIEGQSQQFEILDIDYINSTITLNGSITWNDGDGVSLAYYDNTPDIGAYEYNNSLGLFSAKINNLILYPNPTKDFVFVSDKYIDNDYQIISINGSIIKKGKINPVKINISNMNSGVYILKILNRELNSIITSKLIKE